MEDDRSYYERRLKEELARASTDADEGVRALHRRWAGLYRDRLAGLLGRSSGGPEEVAAASRRLN